MAGLLSVGVVLAFLAPLTQAARGLPQERPSQDILIGRLLDEELRPIANTELDFGVWCREMGGVGTRLRTDEGGRFELHRGLEASRVTYEYLWIEAWRDSPARDRFQEARAWADLTLFVPPGTYDCGDLVLAAPRSMKRLARLRDAQLEDEYHRWHKASRMNGVFYDEYEACLVEMSRRGGESWQSFLRRELEAGRLIWRPSYGDDEHPPVCDLEVLTALRRAEGKPDPLTLVIDGKAPLLFEGSTRRLPVIRFHFKNTDEGGECFALTQSGDSRRSGGARIRVEVRDADGQLVAPPPAPSAGPRIGGGFTRRLLEPGATLPGRIDLDDYVQITRTGDYQLRLQYHDRARITDLDDVSGWIVSSSAPFTLRVRP
ncbi:MAG: hypothetical protein AB1486_03405 [Planctomycetota bacterium]